MGLGLEALVLYHDSKEWTDTRWVYYGGFPYLQWRKEDFIDTQNGTMQRLVAPSRSEEKNYRHSKN